MSQHYSIRNNEVIFFSEEEQEELIRRKDQEINVVLPAQARNQRDLLLQQTDWTQAVDVPQATKDKWAPYRQALRDVPQQVGFPDNVTWPVKP